MKTCSTCGKTYEDETMVFCLDDGTRLVQETAAPDPNATWNLVSPPVTQPGSTVASPQPPVRPTSPSPQATITSQPEYIQNQSPYAAHGAAPDRSRKSAWPWVFAIALIIGASGILMAWLFTRGRQPEVTSVSPPASSTASPTQSVTVTAPDSAKVESTGPANTVGISQVNRQTEKAAPAPKTTPLPRPAPEKTKTEPTAIPTIPAPRAPISGGVMNGKAIHLVQPSYPPIARAAHASGSVTVQVLVDESGNVISAHAASGHPLLQGSAVAAARASKFSPTKLSGQPVKVTGVIIYNFVAQ